MCEYVCSIYVCACAYVGNISSQWHPFSFCSNTCTPTNTEAQTLTQIQTQGTTINCGRKCVLLTKSRIIANFMQEAY